MSNKKQSEKMKEELYIYTPTQYEPYKSREFDSAIDGNLTTQFTPNIESAVVNISPGDMLSPDFIPAKNSQKRKVILDEEQNK